MRTDLRYKITLAAVISLTILLISLLVICLLLSSSIWLGLIPVYIFAGAFILTFILGFVPFMKDHMWLSVTATALISALVGLIIYLVI